MPKVQRRRKDPDSKLEYGFDWSSWLASGETVSTSVWTVPAGITASAESTGTDSTKLTLAGGTAGTNYTVANKVTTTTGQIVERSFVLMVEER